MDESMQVVAFELRTNMSACASIRNKSTVTIITPKDESAFSVSNLQQRNLLISEFSLGAGSFRHNVCDFYECCVDQGKSVILTVLRQHEVQA